MTLSANINDLEKAKFREESGGTVVAVTVVGGAASGTPESNTQISGSATTSAVAYPTVAAGDITAFMIKASVDQPAARRLLYSYDGGVTFFTIRPGDSESVEMYSAITQIYLKSAASTTAFELHLARAS